jgi:hypothetical protein
MSVAIPNYSYKYYRRSKPVFVPSGIGRRIGAEIKAAVEGAYSFEPIYFHLRDGGHVAAMHHHRNHRYFARIDIAKFFYSVSRRRIQSALIRARISNAAFYAKWSTVANPYGDPSYALPYGFIQSPILASLVIATSAIGDHLRKASSQINVGVYVDDISLSSNDLSTLQAVFEATLATIETDGFLINADKLRMPAEIIDIFNCDLTKGQTTVRDDRISKFLASVPSSDASDAFMRYCVSVETGNVMVTP